MALIYKGLVGAWMVFALTVAGGVNAESVKERIRQQFQDSRPDLEIMSIADSPLEGLYEVRFNQGPTVYATADGKHFFLGDLYEVGRGGFINLAEQGREQNRVDLLKEIKREDMIVFSPEGETKGMVYVFTDVDCGYCQKLHQEVPELNKLGIEVRYLAYPRAGVGSATYEKMVRAWCAEDSQKVLTALKNRQSISAESCDDNAVAEQYRLGSQVGVTGTPAIVTTSGKLIPGYMPAKRLAALATR